VQILIIEDEVKIAQVLVEYFERDGFTCAVLHDGTDAVQTIRAQAPDFVVLDVMLPGKDGITICTEVRQFSTVPILMLTARVDESDRLLGLELGADDYVCKPFSPREVVARVKTIMRRAQTSAQPTTAPEMTRAPTHVYRGVSVFFDRYVCLVGEAEIDLTPVEFRLLAAMIAAPQRVFSRDQLMNAAYDDDRIVSRRTIDSHLSNMRRKLAAQVGEDLIRPVYGVGYKLE
jgi:two-component system response regulator BaeR